MSSKKIDKLIVVSFIIGAIFLTIFFQYFLNKNNLLVNKSVQVDNNTRRIASLAPSITEIIYKLNLDNLLLANTEYCTYPEDAKNKLHIGSFDHINYELILALGIDTVILNNDLERAKDILQSYGVKTVVVDNTNIDGILKSIKIIGDEFDKSMEAEMIVDEINSRLDNINCDNKTVDNKVMLVIFQEITANDIGKITVAADDNYYNDMINRAGGINIFSDTMAAYPVVDKEAVIRANPDIIIQLMKPADDKELIIKNWLKMKEINAAKNSKIFLLEDIASSIPGPRFIDTLEDIVKIICTEE